MRVFNCVCGNRLYFLNTSCLACGRRLGFLPDVRELSALEQAEDGAFVALAPAAQRARYRYCSNGVREDACNWMLPEAEADGPGGRQEMCLACRLNRVIPNLGKPGNRALWIRIEQRKRRLIYDLLSHGLPLVPKTVDPAGGLAFAFLEDDPQGLEFMDGQGANPVLTGHAGGLITINIAEADDVQRERMRVQMNELQRTLLGHFRHESGHYYWDRLVPCGGHLERVRAIFGDERVDYAGALERYYRDGPPNDWQREFVSAYASSHPWEDWAECWAHYLQIDDTLQTAASIGLAPTEACAAPFRERIGEWVELALKINLINRSLDQPDPYPFVLTTTVVDKLEVIDRVVRAPVGTAVGPSPRRA